MTSVDSVSCSSPEDRYSASTHLRQWIKLTLGTASAARQADRRPAMRRELTRRDGSEDFGERKWIEQDRSGDPVRRSLIGVGAEGSDAVEIVLALHIKKDIPYITS